MAPSGPPSTQPVPQTGGRPPGSRGGVNPLFWGIILGVAIGVTGTLVSSGRIPGLEISRIICPYTSNAAVPRPTTTADATSGPTPTPSPDNREQLLIRDMSDFYEYNDCLYHTNNVWDISIRVSVILVSLLSTFTAQIAADESGGLRFWRKASVFTAALTTAIAAIQTAFPFADRANLYQTLAYRTDSLLSDIRLAPATPAPEVIFRDFQQVKADAAANSAGGNISRTPVSSPSPLLAAPTATTLNLTPLAATPIPSATPTPSPTALP